ncbi:MAG: hypothetical protein WCE61_04120 [Candidatus Acidiferrum sp.]
MKPAKPNKRTRGRRRFKTKLIEQSEITGLPYGGPVQTINLADRHKLLTFLPKGVWPPLEPLNFAETADTFFREKQLLIGQSPDLLKKLDHFQSRNYHYDLPGVWNDPELPPKLLREALSQCPEAALRSYAVVRRALARLYAVAWYGRGAEAVAARGQLAQLLPEVRKGTIPHPITKHLPEIVEKFRELRAWILESDKLMQEAYPKWNPDRWQKLAELWGEGTAVIEDALRKKERPFIAERLATVLEIPSETARKAVAKFCHG